MIRTLVVALLATTALSGTSHAQSAPRPMPSYEDGQETPPPPQGGYDDSYGSGDARRDGGYPATPPPRTYNGNTQANGWTPAPPYARDDQVDQGRPDDEAHQRDRADTADLNRKSLAGRNEPPTARNATAGDEYRAELAEHQRAMAGYRADQARYAERIASWRARADACERGNIDACEGPEN